MYLSVKHNYPSILKYLLFETNADVKIKDRFDNTLLHVAAKHATEGIVAELLKSDAQFYINSENKQKQVPLHLVENPKVLHLLCRNGALTNVKDITERTPREYYWHNPERSKLFEELKGVDPNIDSKTKEAEIPLPKSAVGEAAIAVAEIAKDSTKKLVGVTPDFDS